MNRGIAAILAASIAAAFSALPILASAGSDWESAASRIAAYCAESGVARVSVLPFRFRGGAEKSEAEYVAESLSAALAGLKRPALIERSQLEQVLKESSYNYSPGGLDAVFSVDAVVLGTVFASGDKLKAVIKLVDVRSGAVLMAARGEAGREWPEPGFPESEPLEAFASRQLAAAMKLQPPFPKPPGDLRDAIAAGADAGCEGRATRLARLNEELVDVKARYWARKMKEPGFSTRDLRRNPGSEIADPAVKARFYSLLKVYYDDTGAKPPSGAGLPLLLETMKEENAYYNECRRF